MAWTLHTTKTPIFDGVTYQPEHVLPINPVYTGERVGVRGSFVTMALYAGQCQDVSGQIRCAYGKIQEIHPHPSPLPSRERELFRYRLSCAKVSSDGRGSAPVCRWGHARVSIGSLTSWMHKWIWGMSQACPVSMFTKNSHSRPRMSTKQSPNMRRSVSTYHEDSLACVPSRTCHACFLRVPN